MSKVAMTVLKDTDDTRLSAHFGLARVVLVHDPDTGESQRIRNTGLSGGAVVRTMVEHGCTDAIFSEIGDGAFGHLQRAGIRGWYGPQDVPAGELLRRLADGELQPAVAASHTNQRRHHGRRRTG